MAILSNNAENGISVNGSVDSLARRARLAATADGRLGARSDEAGATARALEAQMKADLQSIKDSKGYISQGDLRTLSEKYNFDVSGMNASDIGARNQHLHDVDAIHDIHKALTDWYTAYRKSLQGAEELYDTQNTEISNRSLSPWDSLGLWLQDNARLYEEKGSYGLSTPLNIGKGLHYILDSAVVSPIKGLFGLIDPYAPADDSGRYLDVNHAREAETTRYMQGAVEVLSGVMATKSLFARNGIEDLSLISKPRANHILYGDVTGGGHKWGFSRYFNGKSKFPISWSNQKILNTISDVATDPTLKQVWTRGAPGSLYTKSGLTSRYYVEGVREGLLIRSVYEPATSSIISGFPVR